MKTDGKKYRWPAHYLDLPDDARASGTHCVWPHLDAAGAICCNTMNPLNTEGLPR